MESHPATAKRLHTAPFKHARAILNIDTDNAIGCGEQLHLQHGLEGLLALRHGGLHVESPGVDDLVGHVDLDLLYLVAHQRLDAVCVQLPAAPAVARLSRHHDKLHFRF